MDNTCRRKLDGQGEGEGKGAGGMEFIVSRLHQPRDKFHMLWVCFLVSSACNVTLYRIKALTLVK